MNINYNSESKYVPPVSSRPSWGGSIT